MSETIWKKVAIAGFILALLIELVSGMALTNIIATLFGLAFSDLTSLDWTQIDRPPIIVTLIAIWLPLPIGWIWALSLIRAQRYGWSLLVSLLTPFVSLLLLALGIVLVLLPLGDGALPNPRWLQGA